MPARAGIGNLVQQAKPAPNMLDRLDVRGSSSGRHARPQPRADRFLERACLGQVIGERFRYGRFASFGLPQDVDDATVHEPSLGLQHRFVRHPLQQGVSEFVAHLRTVSPRQQNLRLDQRFQPLLNLSPRLLSSVRRKSSVNERPMHAAACAMRRAPGRRSRRSDINSASMSGTPPSLRCGAGPCDCSSMSEMTSCSRKNGTPSAAAMAFEIISSDSSPRPAPTAPVRGNPPTPDVQVNRLVNVRKRRSLRKGPHRQDHQNRQFWPRRSRCPAAVRPMTGPASARLRSRGSPVARLQPA